MSMNYLRQWLDAGGSLEQLEDENQLEFQPSLADLEEKLKNLDPQEYAKTRNHINGAVSRLSPYLRHGVIASLDLLNRVHVDHPAHWQGKFFQEVIWREYFHKIADQFPDLIWEDAEAYKTGFEASDYFEHLPAEITEARTGCALIDQIIEQLLSTGYLHNRCRLYLASYVVHFKRVRWQAGAKWMLGHLIDGDIASNNLSWQWVASTFSAKPYLFNLASANSFFDEKWNLEPGANQEINHDFATLERLLFSETENL